MLHLVKKWEVHAQDVNLKITAIILAAALARALTGFIYMRSHFHYIQENVTEFPKALSLKHLSE